MRSQDDEYPAY